MGKNKIFVVTGKWESVFVCITTGKHEHAQLQRRTSSATQFEERFMPTTKCIMLPLLLLLLLLLHDGVCRCEEYHSSKVFERTFFTILNEKKKKKQRNKSNYSQSHQKSTTEWEKRWDVKNRDEKQIV